jgi:glycosyltransferase involved in cell wall biosynthesis
MGDALPEPSGPPAVLFFGTFRRNKGVPVLLRAIEALRDLPDVRFHFAGRGAEDVEAMVREAAGRDPRITAEIGFASHERKHELYRGASLIVLPYTSFASLSGVMRDAYSFRVPLVVTDVGALGEEVREEGIGWVVPPGDPDALSRALAEALQDPEARRRASERLLAEGRSRSHEAVGRALRDLYERAAGRSYGTGGGR